jgi:hypothetical protein
VSCKGQPRDIERELGIKNNVGNLMDFSDSTVLDA